MNILKRLIQLDNERYELTHLHNLDCVICVQHHHNPIQITAWLPKDNSSISATVDAVTLEVESGELTVLDPGNLYIPSEVFTIKENVKTWMNKEIN